MAKDTHDDALSRSEYRKELYALRVELVKLQSHVIKHGLRILVLFEGRDAAGKDGAIKRIVKHLSPRETRVVALGKPSDHDEASWYFERFTGHLPASGEMVLFNRSWYNRAGVERVMGFCSAGQYEAFLDDAPAFENLLVRSGIALRKFYLDITKEEQQRRLAARRSDPLTQWKVSPIDEVATDNWDGYSAARDQMFAKTHTDVAPWDVVRTDDKRIARLALIKAILSGIDYKGRDQSLLDVDPEVVFRYSLDRTTEGRLVP